MFLKLFFHGDFFFSLLYFYFFFFPGESFRFTAQQGRSVSRVLQKQDRKTVSVPQRLACSSLWDHLFLRKVTWFSSALCSHLQQCKGMVKWYNLTFYKLCEVYELRARQERIKPKLFLHQFSETWFLSPRQYSTFALICVQALAEKGHGKCLNLEVFGHKIGQKFT